MDFQKYTERLEASIKEKLFFINQVELESYDFILDFGSGTGLLLNEVVSKIKKTDGKMFCGYDKNKEMINIARDRYSKTGLLCFTDNFEHIEETIKASNRTLIIFSSVLHEVDEEDFDFILHVMRMFDTIVLRDMKRPTNNEPISNNTRKRILKEVPKWQADLFEKKWGKIRDKENLYRFFLMNEFVENFESEVQEDYFSVPWAIINWELQNYLTTYCRSYTLRYRKAQVLKRFNHNMKDITHCEMILERINTNEIEEEEE